MKANRKHRKGIRSYPAIKSQQEANESFTFIVNEIMKVEKVDLEEAKKRAWMVLVSAKEIEADPRSKADQMLLDGISTIPSTEHRNLPPCPHEYLQPPANSH